MARAIRCEYGQYFLVCLLSGRWSAVWYAFKGTDAFQAILREDQGWFDNQTSYARPKVHDTRTKALQEIIKSLRDAPMILDDGAYYEIEIKKAQRALDLALHADAKAGPIEPKVIDCDASMEHSESKQQRKNRIDFQREAISTALRFTDWSERTGHGLSISTFFNQFDYRGPYTGDVYQAVERILHAALLPE
ncbi:hypothetical protein RCH14_004565 [Massilia sp. MP_M2]|uniref:hypothetical protein n=1 Tax=Massilia sp. MP_M2 TaxID=3071713 RepID=UPI00319E00C4